MTVIARDQVAADHLVYSWPFPIGPECEVSCADDEQVVMCPAWMVGDRLGPGRHRWRTPDPSRPVGAFFVLTAPVAVSFDMWTRFSMPNGQPMRIRASGSLHVRCTDPGLLVAQFVGLPFDSVNEGVLRSVSRSVERMLGRLLIRRVVMSGSSIAVTDGGMQPGIIEELIAYNPTAGAVFGVELIRLGHLVVAADDGSSPYLELPQQNLDWSGSIPRLPPEVNYPAQTNGEPANGHAEAPSSPREHPRPATPVQSHTVRGMPAMTPRGTNPPGANPPERLAAASGEIVPRHPSTPPGAVVSGETSSVVSGEITSGEIVSGSISSGSISSGSISSGSQPPTVASGEIKARSSVNSDVASGEIHQRAKTPTTPGLLPMVAPPPLPPLPPPPVPRRAKPIEVVGPADETTDQADIVGIANAHLNTPLPGALRATTSDPSASPIMGIGMGAIGGAGGANAVSAAASSSGSISLSPGKRVLVPGPNGLMQSATVRQLLQGYYELEVGSSGETIWVPINGVVPE